MGSKVHRRKVLLLLARGFELYEASVFTDVVGWDDSYGSGTLKLVTCGSSSPVRGSFGVSLIPDIETDSVIPTEYSALALPGGFQEYGFYEDACSKRFLQLIRKFNDLEIPIFAVCTGGVVLARSGVLKGRRATTYGLLQGKRMEQLRECGAQTVNGPIVTHGNVTTSAGPSSAVSVALKMLEHLSGEKNARRIQGLMGFV